MSRWSPGVVANNTPPDPLTPGQTILSAILGGLADRYAEAHPSEEEQLARERAILTNDTLRSRLLSDALEREQGTATTVGNLTEQGFRSPMQAAHAAPVELPNFKPSVQLPSYTGGLPAGTPTPRTEGGTGPGFGAEPLPQSLRRPAALSPVNAFADAIEERDRNVFDQPHVNVGGQDLYFSPEAKLAMEQGRAGTGGRSFEQQWALNQQNIDARQAQDETRYQRAVGLFNRRMELEHEKLRLDQQGQRNTEAYRAADAEWRAIQTEIDALSLLGRTSGMLAPSNPLDARVQGRTPEGAERIGEGQAAQGQILKALNEILSNLKGRRAAPPAGGADSTGTITPDAVRRRRGQTR